MNKPEIRDITVSDLILQLQGEGPTNLIKILVDWGLNIESLLLGLCEYAHSQKLEKVTYRLEQALSAYQRNSLVDTRRLESLNE